MVFLKAGTAEFRLHAKNDIEPAWKDIGFTVLYAGRLEAKHQGERIGVMRNECTFTMIMPEEPAGGTANWSPFPQTLKVGKYNLNYTIEENSLTSGYCLDGCHQPFDKSTGHCPCKQAAMDQRDQAKKWFEAKNAKQQKRAAFLAEAAAFGAAVVEEKKAAGDTLLLKPDTL
eukprot:886309-Prymnesium_polylepis.1